MKSIKVTFDFLVHDHVDPNEVAEDTFNLLHWHDPDSVLYRSCSGFEVVPTDEGRTRDRT